MEAITKKILNEEELNQIELDSIEFFRTGSAQDTISIFCKKDNQIVCMFTDDDFDIDKTIEFIKKLGSLNGFQICNLGMGHFLKMREKYYQVFIEKLEQSEHPYRESKKIIIETISEIL